MNDEDVVLPEQKSPLGRNKNSDGGVSPSGKVSSECFFSLSRFPKAP